ncbi:MAG: HD domain-containing phosphohydrolase [Chlamydiales bacterium]
MELISINLIAHKPLLTAFSIFGGGVTLVFIFGSFFKRSFPLPRFTRKEITKSATRDDSEGFDSNTGQIGHEIESLASGFKEVQATFGNTLKTFENKVRKQTRELIDTKKDLVKLAGYLERGKQEWESTFDAISDPISIIDQNHNIIRANRGLARRLGLEPKNVIGKKCYEVFGCKMSSEESCPHDKVILSNLPESSEMELTNLGGIFHVSTFPLLVPGENISGTVHICRDITEQRNLDIRIREEAEISSSLLEVSNVLSSSLDFNTLLLKVIEVTTKLIRCDRSALFLWEEENQVFIPQAFFGFSDNLLPKFRAQKFGVNEFPFFKEALTTRKPVTIPDCLHSDLIAPEVVPVFGIRSLHITPIVRHGKVIGTLHIGQTKTPRIWTPKEINLVLGIAHQTATMIENSHFYRNILEKNIELSRHIETIGTMHEIDMSILSRLDRKEILDEISERISGLVAADHISIFTMDDQNECFQYEAGIKGDQLTAVKVPLNGINASEVFTSMKPVVRQNLSEESYLPLIDKNLYQQGFQSDMKFPLFVKKKVTAILILASRRIAAFTKEDFSIVEKISSQISVALENAALVKELKDTLISTTVSLALAVEAKSPWTQKHSERVAEYAIKIASEMGISEGEKKDLRLAGLLHDIGKIGIYESILDKPGRLTPEETDLVKQHCMKGVEILKPIRGLEAILPLIAHHHENYDGSGYPNGLEGESIPFLSRILAMADAYDSMTADRPYRKAPGKAFAMMEMQRCSGKQFDPNVVSAFLKLLG